MFDCLALNIQKGCHQTRAKSLTACIQSAMSGQALTVASMGRSIQSQAHEKQNIKRADRLCSNPRLLAQIPLIYQRICTLIVSNPPVNCKQRCKPSPVAPFPEYCSVSE
jgi:hypothetical protein